MVSVIQKSQESFVLHKSKENKKLSFQYILSILHSASYNYKYKQVNRKSTFSWKSHFQSNI